MKKILTTAIVGAACLIGVGSKAATINLTVDPNQPFKSTLLTPYTLGAANPGAPASAADDVVYINGILGLALGGTGTAGADTIYRSFNVFTPPPLPAATLYGNVGNSVGNTPPGTTSLTDNGYFYLAAKYDGPNGGTEVWYLGGLAHGTAITIPNFAFGDMPANGQYGLSGWEFLTPTSDNPNFPPQGGVPDVGSTLALLGCALVGVESVRRKMLRS